MATPMGGIFNTPFKFRSPAMGGQISPSQPSTSSGQIMPTGSPMGDLGTSQQNSFMPQGAVGGIQPPSMPQPSQDQNAPLTQADYSQRAPIMNPNHGYMLDAMKAGVQNPQSTSMTPGVPQSNTPATNMQNVPFWMNQLLQGSG